MAEERWLPLIGDVQAAVSDVHRFGADALLLAHFAAPKRAETVCELGTGCGAIALRLCAASPAAAVHGVDLAPEAIALARQSAAALAAAHPERPRPTFAAADWRQPRTIASAGSFDRVVCNPPYFPPGSGAVSRSDAIRLARHEQPDTLPALCRAAVWLLRFGGTFCLCHRPERLPSVLEELAAVGLQPKRLLPVQQRPDTPPWLFLLAAVKGGRPGLTWEAPLTMDSPACRAIYGE